MHMSEGSHGVQERTSGLLELVMDSCETTWMLGIKLRSYIRAGSVLTTELPL